MNTQENSIEVNRQLVDVLDELLVAGNWEASLFLRAAGKQIHELRDRANQLLIEVTGDIATQKNNAALEKADHIKAYVSLYQNEGTNLTKWYQMIKALTEHSVSRPVYRQEEQVKTLIRSKADAQHEGFVVAFIKESDVLQMPFGKTAVDRFGNELLTLRPGAVKLENIIEFVHNQQSYLLQENGLVLKHNVNVQ
jgi:intracellular multiplication protein IcmQ